MSGREKKEKRKVKRGGKRNAYFCIVFTKLSRKKIHSVIKILPKHYGLKWLQVRMSYRILLNLGEILQGDMVGKLRKGIGSKDFLNCECNCNSRTKVKVTCA